MANSVFVLGVWDLFHKGHQVLIKKASKLGDLTVGVVRDSAVKLQKGEDRPIYSEADRMGLIADLAYVKKVILVDGFFIPQDIISTYDVILIGEDQSHITNLVNIPFDKIFKLPRYAGVSTSDIVKRIKGEEKTQ